MMASAFEFFLAVGLLFWGTHLIGVYAKSKELGLGLFFVGVGLIGGIFAIVMWTVEKLPH